MERSGMASCAAMSWPRPVCPSKLHIAEIHRGSSLGAVLEPTGPQSTDFMAGAAHFVKLEVQIRGGHRTLLV